MSSCLYTAFHNETGGRDWGLMPRVGQQQSEPGNLSNILLGMHLDV
jgi:hypothetical protein